MSDHPASFLSAPIKCHVIRDTFSPLTADFPAFHERNSAKNADSKCHVLRDTSAAAPQGVIELRVRNHPGTMSHITGLFARRAFNLDAIVCVPVGDGATSRMLLLVSNDARLEQVERQLAKLHDVLEIEHRADLDAAYFAQVLPISPRSADQVASACNASPTR